MSVHLAIKKTVIFSVAAVFHEPQSAAMVGDVSDTGGGQTRGGEPHGAELHQPDFLRPEPELQCYRNWKSESG